MASQILPHGEFQQLVPNLWYLVGSLPHGDLPRNMVVYRLADKSLIIHSAIALNTEGMQKLEALGEPKVLIVPNRLHRLDAAFYKERYKNISVICPEGALAPVQKKVKVDSTCEEFLASTEVKYHAPGGIAPGELCYELPVEGGIALVVTDMLFNLPHGKGFGGFIFKVLGSTGFFGITKIGKLFMLRNKKDFKNWLLQMSEKEVKFICVGHGEPIRENCKQKLQEAANRL